METLMKLLEMVRKYAFWMVDFLKGGKVRKHYRDILFEIRDASSDKAVQRREKDLSDLLSHAVSTTRFYKDKKGFSSLADFPVINKSVVRGAFDSLVSSKFEQSELIPVVTSGSTGTPFKVYHDRNKRLRNSADAIVFAQMAGYTVGDRLISMKTFVRGTKKKPLNYWMENTIPVDVIKLNDIQIDALLRQMENNRSTYIIVGYSSALDLVSKYVERNNYGTINAEVTSVIAISETLNGYTKKILQKYFGARVLSRYSNLENGIIAQQELAASGRYIINTASYVVEILKMDSDEQAERGQMGRIVVTDLFNYGLPLIRYDTGDVGTLSQDSSNKGNMYLDIVEGRKLDLLYDTNGNLVSCTIVLNHMRQYPEIRQYQLIQEGPIEYTLKINAGDTFTGEVKLINELKTYLGEDSIFRVEYVDEIPLLSSAKRKAIASNYSPPHS
jgi:phenylacetate-CoA ligase